MSVPDQFRAELKAAMLAHADQLTRGQDQSLPLRRAKRRLTRLLPSSAVALIAVGVAVAAFASRGTTPPTASAATVLRAAAAALERSDIDLRLGAHTYLYERTIERSRFLDPSGTTVLHALDESWRAQNGAGREHITVLNRSAVRDLHAAGSGLFRLHPSRQPFTLVGGVSLSYSQLQQLPTSPAALAKVVDRFAYKAARAVVESSRSAHSMFVLYILRSISLTPASKATRAAVYKVMASTPGIRLVGQRRDALGREGELLTATLGPEQAEIIIDPGTGKLLQFTRTLTHRSRLYPGWRPGLIARDTYVDETTIGSTTARP